LTLAGNAKPCNPAAAEAVGEALLAGDAVGEPLAGSSAPLFPELELLEPLLHATAASARKAARQTAVNLFRIRIPINR